MGGPPSAGRAQDHDRAARQVMAVRLPRGLLAQLHVREGVVGSERLQMTHNSFSSDAGASVQLEVYQGCHAGQVTETCTKSASISGQLLNNRKAYSTIPPPTAL